MRTSTFSLNEEKVAELHEAVVEAARRITDDLGLDLVPKENIPTESQLRVLLETAFWASLTPEEGRYSTFQLTLWKRSDVGRHFAFRREEPLEVALLARLAPALDREDVEIGVWPDKDGRLEVWGFSLHSSISSVKVRVIQPGQLLVSVSVTKVALITGDQILTFRGRSLRFELFPWNRLFPTESEEEKGHWKWIYTPRVAEKIQLLTTFAGEMRRHGRGGILLVVPRNNDWKTSVEAEPKFEADRPASSLGDLYAELVALLVAQEVDKAAVRAGSVVSKEELSPRIDRLRDALRNVRHQMVGLTAIDGATIMTNSLETVAFGAKIISKPERKLTVTIEHLGTNQPRLENQPIEKLGNMRHQSVARFAAEQKNALGIVVSQDGHVTFLAWDNSTDVLRAIKNSQLECL